MSLLEFLCKQGACLLLAFSPFCLALPSDKNEIVHINGDSATINYKTGTKTFVGNVNVRQGSTHLTADRLVTKNNQRHEVREAIAYGLQRPAHYWTLPQRGESEVHAYASIIKYYPIVAHVILEKNAVVTQNNNRFQGPRIYFNMNEQTVYVPASKEGQVVLEYDPSKR